MHRFILRKIVTSYPIGLFTYKPGSGEQHIKTFKLGCSALNNTLEIKAPKATSNFGCKFHR